MYLSLPIPSTKNNKVDIHQCLEAFVRMEVMEKADAWYVIFKRLSLGGLYHLQNSKPYDPRNCPACKTLRKATKTLSLSRLPPVLLIHLKRFSFKGPFTDKIEKLVEFPLKGLDLTNYMPPPLPPGVDRTGTQTYPPDDPRLQIPPYRYDLYGVTNHFGSLSSGHCTYIFFPLVFAEFIYHVTSIVFFCVFFGSRYRFYRLQRRLVILRR